MIFLNYYTKFLLRLFLGFLILFGLSISDKYQIFNLNDIKDKLSYNINPLTIINKINGKLELVDLGTEEETTVSTIYKEYDIINDNIRRYYCDEFSPVTNHIAGVVTKINKNKEGIYTITIQGIDNKIYQYSNLESFNYHIYDYIKTDDVIGDSVDYYELMINES